MSASVQPPLSFARLLRSQCPHCGSGEVWRTHRRTVFDWVVSPLSVRPYRCWQCNHRFHAVPSWRMLALPLRTTRGGKNRREATGAKSSHSKKRPGRTAKMTRLLTVVLIAATLVVWFLVSLAEPPPAV